MSQVQKETEYFVGLVKATSKDQPCPPDEATSLSRVTSGDPSRGAMAVDTESSFTSGDYLQVCHLWLFVLKLRFRSSTIILAALQLKGYRLAKMLRQSFV